mmetsp:Transcript_52453/g.147225  ORF Transcript_52453/g.147225 Transcript_52453/m.147225 type:complete len:226 (+) Transcript_52453:170-847(+)
MVSFRRGVSSARSLAWSASYFCRVDFHAEVAKESRGPACRILWLSTFIDSSRWNRCVSKLSRSSCLLRISLARNPCWWISLRESTVRILFMVNLTFFSRPWCFQRIRFCLASCCSAMRKFFSLRHTYQSLCMSSNDFSRKSTAGHGSPDTAFSSFCVPVRAGSRAPPFQNSSIPRLGNCSARRAPPPTKARRREAMAPERPRAPVWPAGPGAGRPEMLRETRRRA